MLSEADTMLFIVCENLICTLWLITSIVLWFQKMVSKIPENDAENVMKELNGKKKEKLVARKKRYHNTA